MCYCRAQFVSYCISLSPLLIFNGIIPLQDCIPGIKTSNFSLHGILLEGFFGSFSYNGSAFLLSVDFRAGIPF